MCYDKHGELLSRKDGSDKMELVPKCQDRIDHIIDRVADRDKQYVDDVGDLLLWGYYGPDVLSQFGFGLSGWVFRQGRGTCVMTVKVVESGVPLVAFITSGTTRGCIRQLFDCLERETVKWQKDRYPWN